MSMKTEREMQNGQRVRVRLAGEDGAPWHQGTVIDAGRQWVEIPQYPSSTGVGPFIADENNIVEWEPLA